MKIIAVCGHCGNHDIDATLEFNFKNSIVYYICPNCQKESKMSLLPDVKPYPKSSTMRNMR